MLTNKTVYLYGLYDDKDNLVMLGTSKEVAAYLNISPDHFRSGISHAKHTEQNQRNEDGGIMFRGYKVYKFKEDELDG